MSPLFHSILERYPNGCCVCAVFTASFCLLLLPLLHFLITIADFIPALLSSSVQASSCVVLLFISVSWSCMCEKRCKLAHVIEGYIFDKEVKNGCSNTLVHLCLRNLFLSTAFIMKHLFLSLLVSFSFHLFAVVFAVLLPAEMLVEKPNHLALIMYSVSVEIFPAHTWRTLRFTVRKDTSWQRKRR